MAARQTTSESSWQRPAAEQYGLRRFLATMRERAGLVAVIALAVIGLAVAYLVTANKVYEAQADLLISPIPAEDQTLSGLGLISESVDPTLDVQTAAQLVRTHAIAERTASRFPGKTADEILDEVTVEPVGQSNVLAVVGSANSPDQAAELANAFAEAAVDERSDRLRNRLAEVLPELRRQQEELAAGSGGTSVALGEQIARLASLAATGDPTVRLENRAEPPDSAASPRPALTLVLAVFAGLILGIGGAYAIQVLDPRLRREEQLRARYRLPILARIPLERHHASSEAPLPWQRLSAGGIESYRALRAVLTAPRGERASARTFMVTGAQPSEGKSTVAINLAHSLARSGGGVLLIEADLRRPAIGRALGHETVSGVVSVMIGERTLDEAVVRSADDGIHPIDLLLAEPSGPGVEELFSLPAAEQLIADAKRRYSYIVIDTPPITEVVDALPLARQVDAVMLVVRLGKTRLGRIRELAELLAGSRVKPVGFVVVGGAREARGYYYHEATPPKRRISRRPELSETPSGATQPPG